MMLLSDLNGHVGLGDGYSAVLVLFGYDDTKT